EDGCLLWGSRVVVPLTLKEKVLSELHDGHPGITRMKAVARSFVWWPKMDMDIKTKVKQCNACQQTREAPSKAPLHNWGWPEGPWSRIHIDYAGPFMGKMFLVVVDAHSKWLEVLPVLSATVAVTIEKLRFTFATHGLPDALVSDNAPVFTCEEFRSFYERNGIKHIRVAPYHPASNNGLAERAVQTFKNGMRKVNGGTVE
uniref:Gypsy retrotransposon integrase-like protein 1 n=1 Tax=Latimeria chalumnae TaxID=7897 RepID=H2ZWC5_LATCH